MLSGFTLSDAFGGSGDKVFYERFGGYGKMLYLCGAISRLERHEGLSVSYLCALQGVSAGCACGSPAWVGDGIRH